MTFQDLKATFDTVPKYEMWNALATKIVSKYLLQAIKLAHRNVKVSINGKESESRGSDRRESISPLLFIILMDEVL